MGISKKLLKRLQVLYWKCDKDVYRFLYVFNLCQQLADLNHWLNFRKLKLIWIFCTWFWFHLQYTDVNWIMPVFNIREKNQSSLCLQNWSGNLMRMRFLLRLLVLSSSCHKFWENIPFWGISASLFKVQHLFWGRKYRHPTKK